LRYPIESVHSAYETKLKGGKMKFIFKETTLTDGSTVQDVQLIANGQSGAGITAKPICIFSCTSERDALAFLNGLEKLMELHTLERLEET
jgi:hypothetical protein